MMDFEFVDKLIRAMDASSLDSIEIERGGTRIRLAKTPPAGSGPVYAAAPAVAAAPIPMAPAAAPAAAAVPAAPTAVAASEAPAIGSNWVDVTSPMVGTFYRAPSPDAPSFVDVGGRIVPGDTLCIIEAMKLMNELEAEVSGTIREVLVQNGEPVEYGQVLFRVEPAA
jgi:acetyl-CoA carboxylase biotin carboxyl carrier protein